MAMQKLVWAVLLMGLTLACGPGGQPVPTESGIEGQVTIGPVCPASQEGTPCPDEPYEATLVIRDAASRVEVAKVQSTPDGTYRVELESGEYLVEPQPANPTIPPYAESQTVTVEQGRFTTLNILYDSGIR